MQYQSPYEGLRQGLMGGWGMAKDLDAMKQRAEEIAMQKQFMQIKLDEEQNKQDFRKAMRGQEVMGMMSDGGAIPSTTDKFQLDPMLNIPRGTGEYIAPSFDEQLNIATRYGDPMDALKTKATYLSRDKGGITSKVLLENFDKFDKNTQKVIGALIGFPDMAGKQKNPTLGNDVETVLSWKFPGFMNDEEIRNKAYDWMGTPEGARTVRDEIVKLSKDKAPNIYNVIPGYQLPNGQPAVLDVRRGTDNRGKYDLQKTPSESDIKEARTKTSMDAVIGEFENSFNKATPSLPSGPVDRVTGYPGRLVGTVAQTDPALRLADNLSKGFLAKFARAAGEVGTLTDQDIDRAAELVPSIHDVPEVRSGKMAEMRALATEIYNRGKRQENPLGQYNADRSNLPPFDVSLTPGQNPSATAKNIIRNGKPSSRFTIKQVR